MLNQTSFDVYLPEAQSLTNSKLKKKKNSTSATVVILGFYCTLLTVHCEPGQLNEITIGNRSVLLMGYLRFLIRMRASFQGGALYRRLQ